MISISIAPLSHALFPVKKKEKKALHEDRLASTAILWLFLCTWEKENEYLIAKMINKDWFFIRHDLDRSICFTQCVHHPRFIIFIISLRHDCLKGVVIPLMQKKTAMY